MKKGQFIRIFLLFCVMMVPVIVPAQHVAVFQKNVSVTSPEKSLFSKGFVQSDDFRVPNSLLHPYHGGRAFVNHMSFPGIADESMKTSPFAKNDCLNSLQLPAADHALDYLLHIYPSHNFW